MDLQASRVAVADVNHGGLALAKELLALGYDAFAVDIYGTRKLHDDAVKIVRPADAGRFDALVVPVHLPPDELRDHAQKNSIPVFTHHRMAGMIARETGRLNGIRSVEITGTYGKTTTAFALSGMLAAAGERVLLHTSHGLFFDGKSDGKRLKRYAGQPRQCAGRGTGYRPAPYDLCRRSLARRVRHRRRGRDYHTEGRLPDRRRDIPLLDRQDADD